MEDAIGPPPGVDEWLQQHVSQFTFSFTVSDVTHADMPIVYASPGFLELTGYRSEEVLGRNCRFLQGPLTERQKVMEIRDAIREDRACQVCLLNYRKDGSAFWNQFYLAPIRNAAGSVIHYVGIQSDVTHLVAQAEAQEGVRAAQQQQATLSSAPGGGAGAGAGAGAAGTSGRQQGAEEPQAPHVSSVSSPFSRTAAAAAGMASATPTAAGAAGGGGAGETASPSGQQAALPHLFTHQHSELCPGVAEVAMQEACGASELAQALCSEPLPAGSVLMQGVASALEAHGSGGGGLPCSLLQKLVEVQQSFVLADPNLPDMPIVHASDKFCELSGYPREAVVGRNCRFLQGPGTDRAQVARLKAAITADPPAPVTVTLLNYRGDTGEPFWNSLHVAPVRDAAGGVVFFIGVQIDVTQAASPERASAAAAHAAAVAGHAAAAEAAVAAGAAAAAAATAAQQPACGTSASGAGPATHAPAPAVTLSQKMVHQGVTGAVRVAVRSLGGEQGLRRSAADQGLPMSRHASMSSSASGSMQATPSGSSKSLLQLGGQAGAEENAA